MEKRCFACIYLLAAWVRTDWELEACHVPVTTELAFQLGQFDAGGINVVVDLEKESTGIFTLDIELPENTEIEVGYDEQLIDLRPHRYDL